MQKEKALLNDQFVRVDSVVLPDWAKNRHQFIALNYLALEHPDTRANINHWIDLVFGYKQQKAEYFNLFKAITSEVILLVNVIGVYER